MGTHQTGTSSVVGKERLVAKGIFVGGGFFLQRDLDSVDANPTTSSELFVYNPRLLFTMPDSPSTRFTRSGLAHAGCADYMAGSGAVKRNGGIWGTYYIYPRNTGLQLSYSV